MKIAVIIPAAGASTRFISDPGKALGGGALGARSKLDEELGDRPVLHRTVELFTDQPDVHAIIVAGPADPDAMASFKLRHQDKLAVFGVTLCAGSPNSRAESIALALEHVPDDTTHIAVHDAARPCASTKLIERIFEAATKLPAVVPAVAVSDAIKRAAPEATAYSEVDPLDAILGGVAETKNESRKVTETIERTNLYAAQTPQIFEADLLRRAYKEARSQDSDLTDPSPDPSPATDDAALVERLGQTVHLIEGETTNIKITTPPDLPIARAIMGFRPPKKRADHLKF